MIEVASYLMKNNKLVPCREFEGRIKDPDYIEGSVELIINGTEIISAHWWDYIDDLWAIIISGLVEIYREKPFSSAFPDQPIYLNFEPLYGERVKVSSYCHERRATVVNKREFIDEIGKEAKAYMEFMWDKAPRNMSIYAENLKKIKDVSMPL